MRMDDNADAKRILLASSPADWRRQPGRPRISTVDDTTLSEFTDKGQASQMDVNVTQLLN